MYPQFKKKHLINHQEKRLQKSPTGEKSFGTYRLNHCFHNFDNIFASNKNNQLGSVVHCICCRIPESIEIN